MIRRIDDQMAVAPQIAPGDVAAIKAAGFVGIVNNRPDDEQPGQPAGEAIRAAAQEAGLWYAAIPVDHSGFAAPQVAAMAAKLATADGPVLAFCRSGTRSCYLWGLATAQAGGDPDAIVAAGGGAGYDLSGIRPLLDSLAARS